LQARDFSRMNRVVEVILRILGAGVGVCLIVDGIFCFRVCADKEWRDYIVSVILIVSGGVIGLAELGLSCIPARVCSLFSFLNSRLSRGVFYVVCGALAITKIWWMTAIGAGSIALGALNIILHVACRNREQKGKAKNPKPEPREMEENSSNVSAPDNKGDRNSSYVPPEVPNRASAPPSQVGYAPSYTVDPGNPFAGADTNDNPFLNR